MNPIPNVEIVLMAVGGVIWAIRQEGRLNQAVQANNRTQKDVDDLRVRHENLDSKLVERLSEVREALARIEGKLDINKEKGD
jgi:hypothetical protein